jgi:predicted PurR-regulated permease PerM
MYSCFYRRSFLIATILILGWTVSTLLQPLWAPLGWAAVLAFLLNPVQERIAARLKGRPSVSAGILTGLTPFVVIAPLVFIAVAFARQVADILTALKGRTVMPYPALLERVDTYPVIGGAMRWLRESAPISAEQVKGWIVDGAQTTLKSAATMSGTLALGIVGSLIGFFMMLFLLFFFLRDGRKMLAHLIRLIPMEPVGRAKLLTDLGNVTRAVVFGSAATALIQGTLVGVGFAIVGLPSPLVFAVLATIAAFLPVGSAIVLIPAVLYLAFAERWGAAIFLAVWSGGVGVVDNFLRPFLAAQRAEVSTLAVFVGAIGGVSAFGVLGLVIGPVLLSFAVALVRAAAARGAGDPE